MVSLKLLCLFHLAQCIYGRVPLQHHHATVAPSVAVTGNMYLQDEFVEAMRSAYEEMRNSELPPLTLHESDTLTNSRLTAIVSSGEMKIDFANFFHLKHKRLESNVITSNFKIEFEFKPASVKASYPHISILKRGEELDDVELPLPTSNSAISVQVDDPSSSIKVKVAVEINKTTDDTAKGMPTCVLKLKHLGLAEDLKMRVTGISSSLESYKAFIESSLVNEAKRALSNHVTTKLLDACQHALTTMSDTNVKKMLGVN